jgi:hypothetical protein
MVLLSPKHKWLCQVEAKVVNSDSCRKGSVFSDLVRVKEPTSFMEFIDEFKRIGEIESYSRYGLFIGGDISWFFLWWKSMDNDEMKKIFLKNCFNSEALAAVYINSLEEHLRGSIKGVFPNPPKGENLWLVYALYEL